MPNGHAMNKTPLDEGRSNPDKNKSDNRSLDIRLRAVEKRLSIRP